MKAVPSLANQNKALESQVRMRKAFPDGQDYEASNPCRARYSREVSPQCQIARPNKENRQRHENFQLAEFHHALIGDTGWMES